MNVIRHVRFILICFLDESFIFKESDVYKSLNGQNQNKIYIENNKCICFIQMMSHDAIVVWAHGKIN